MNPVFAWIITGLILLAMCAVPPKAYRRLFGAALLLIVFPIVLLVFLVFM
jgi:hypothetical protein